MPRNLTSAALAIALVACGQGGGAASETSAAASAKTKGKKGKKGDAAASGSAKASTEVPASASVPQPPVPPPAPAALGAWRRGIGGAAEDLGLALAIDGAGRVIVAGSFRGTVDLGSGATAAAGERDAFVAVYDAGGAPVWNKAYGGATDDEAWAVAVDGEGRAIVAGGFSGKVDFGGGPVDSKGNGWDYYVAVYGASGAHVWSRRFDAGARAIAVDRQKNIYIAGGTAKTIDLGGGPLEKTKTTRIGPPQADLFIAKLDASGAHLWSKRFVGSFDSAGHGIAADSAGNVVVSGVVSGTNDFGGGPLPPVGGAGDCFVVKLDTNGGHLWSKRFAMGREYGGPEVAIDGSDNLYLTGELSKAADFGGGPLPKPKGGSDVFVAKLDPSGAHLWSKTFGGNEEDYGEGVAVGPGGVALVGLFSGSIDFGGGALASAGKEDVFVALLDPAGAYVWSKRFGGPGYDGGRDVALDAAGSAVATGRFEGKASFGDGELASSGDADVFIATARR